MVNKITFKLQLKISNIVYPKVFVNSNKWHLILTSVLNQWSIRTQPIQLINLDQNILC